MSIYEDDEPELDDELLADGAEDDDDLFALDDEPALEEED
jgi:hypothetical protein